MAKNTLSKQLTLDSFKQINDDLWIMEYKCDYGLDELLEGGCSNIMDAVKFLQKKVKTSTLLPNPTHGGFACSTYNAKNENGDYILVTSQKNGIKAEILEALKEIANGEANKVFIPFDATSTLSSLGAIKEVMKENNFIRTGSSPDMYENDTGLYHKTLEFAKERMEI